MGATGGTTTGIGSTFGRGARRAWRRVPRRDRISMTPVPTRRLTGDCNGRRPPRQAHCPELDGPCPRVGPGERPTGSDQSGSDRMDNYRTDRTDGNEAITRYWMIIAGIALLGAGLLGFVPNNPIASSEPAAPSRVIAAHHLLHIVSVLFALAIAFGTRGRQLGNATIGFGVLDTGVAVRLL